MNSYLNRVIWLVAGFILQVVPVMAGDPPRALTVGDFMRVEVAKGTSAPDPCREPNAIFLRLDGLDTGLHAIGCDAPASGPAFLMFRLVRRDAQGPNADIAWARVLGNPWETAKDDFVRTLQISLYGSGAEGVALKSPVVKLTLVRSGMALLGLAIVAVAWGALLVAGKRSSMLRDSNSVETGLRRSYSLARVQMAWWFGLVFGGYVFLWVITGEWSQLNVSILLLMGISGGASLTAASMDLSPGRIMPATAGFLQDILTDAHGITLARLQLVLWNLALGIFFVVRLFADLRMPEFDSATLGLLLVSAGAYLGLKVPEVQGAETSVDPKRGYAPR